MRTRRVSLPFLVPVVLVVLVAVPTAAFTPSGWSTGGPNSSWEWGLVTRGPVGSVAYGSNLDASYHRNECSWLQSPAVDTSGMDGWVLSFEQWYAIEATATRAWDAGVILVSVDGQGWQALSLVVVDRDPHSRAAQCLESHGLDADAVDLVAGRQQAWQSVTIDLSGYAPAETLQVRWLLATDNAIQWDGWYLRNVEMGGNQLLL